MIRVDLLHQFIIWLSIGFIFLYIIVYASGTHSISYKWPVILFIVPFMLSLLDATILNSYTPDEQQFFTSGRRIASSLGEGVIPAMPWDYPNLRLGLYSWFNGLLLFLTGGIEISILATNAGFWGLSMVYWLHTAKVVFNRFSIYTPILFGIYPAGVIWSYQNVRDSMTLLVISAALLNYILWIKEKNRRFILRFLGLIVLLGILRTEIMLTILGATIMSEIISVLRGDRVGSKYLIIVSVIIAILLFIANIFSENIFTYADSLNISFLEQRRSNRANKRFSYLTEMSYQSWIDIIIYLPIRLFYFMYSPFPWHISELDSLWKQYIDSVYMLSLTGLIAIFSRSAFSALEKEHIFLVSYALLTMCGYSIVISDSLNVYRRRLYVVPIIILFVGSQVSKHYSITLESKEY